MLRRPGSVFTQADTVADMAADWVAGGAVVRGMSASGGIAVERLCRKHSRPQHLSIEELD